MCNCIVLSILNTCPALSRIHSLMLLIVYYPAAFNTPFVNRLKLCVWKVN